MHKGHSAVDDSKKVDKLVGMLPKNLQDDIRKEINSTLLNKYPIFS